METFAKAKKQKTIEIEVYFFDYIIRYLILMPFKTNKQNLQKNFPPVKKSIFLIEFLSCFPYSFKTYIHGLPL